MSTVTVVLLGLGYIIVTGSSLFYPYRCNKSPFWQIVGSILPVFNFFYLGWRFVLCSDCRHATHANVFFSSSEQYNHYLGEKAKYKQMRSQFSELKAKRKH